MGNNSESKQNIENTNDEILPKDKSKENLKYFKRALEEVMAKKFPRLVSGSRVSPSEADNEGEKIEP